MLVNQAINRNREFSIYISYARKDQEDSKKDHREQIVDSVCKAFETWGYQIIRDKTALVYQDSIQGFMDEIGKADFVIAVISDKYLKSEYCMYEVLAIFKRGQFRERLFPIVLEDVKIDDYENWVNYVHYWETKYQESVALEKTLPVNTHKIPILERVKVYEEIAQNIVGIVAAIADMNLLTPQLHIQNNFNDIIKKIESQIDQVRSIGIAPNPTADYSVFQLFLDKLLPGLHYWLTRSGLLPMPLNSVPLNNYLRSLKANLGQEINNLVYIPPQAKSLPQTQLEHIETPPDEFVRPIHHIILHILSRQSGGDSASAQIAALNHKTKLVKDILKVVLKTDAPLILLGNPGSGKTMTLKEAIWNITSSQIKRVFPRIPVYVRLGEFYVDNPATPDEVIHFIKRQAPRELLSYFDFLFASGLLIIIFDGMDEMSRDRYIEHTEALSRFASFYEGHIKTLFTCRITDFSPTFIHSRLVILPFTKAQIKLYLKRYLPCASITIELKQWSISRLARYLDLGELPVDTTNPFMLWLLVQYLLKNESWPTNRVEMMESYNVENYLRKNREALNGKAFPSPETTFKAWGRFAYIITERNRGSAIPIELLYENVDAIAKLQTRQMIQLGKLCGVLKESLKGHDYKIRFEHHRFQEFFTARYIYQERLNINWLDKLDSPRWQETMLNVLLMDSSNEAVYALSRSINDSLALFRVFREDASQASKPLHDIELLVSDRIELGARIIRYNSKSEIINQHLKPVITRSINYLADQGNPVTQVKMMRACQNLNDIEIMQSFKKLLHSPIKWLRDQALILISSRHHKRYQDSSNVVAEMGIDVASNTFFQYWRAYLKAVISSKDSYYVYSFIVATLCNALYLLFFIGFAIWAYRFVMNLPDWLKIPSCQPIYTFPRIWSIFIIGFFNPVCYEYIPTSLNPFYFGWVKIIYAALTIGLTWIWMKEKPYKFGFWFPISIYGILSVYFLSFLLWNQISMKYTLMVLYYGTLGMIISCWIFNYLLQKLCLTLYCTGTLSFKTLKSAYFTASNPIMKSNEIKKKVLWIIIYLFAPFILIVLSVTIRYFSYLMKIEYEVGGEFLIIIMFCIAIANIKERKNINRFKKTLLGLFWAICSIGASIGFIYIIQWLSKLSRLFKVNYNPYYICGLLIGISAFSLLVFRGMKHLKLVRKKISDIGINVSIIILVIGPLIGLIKLLDNLSYQFGDDRILLVTILSGAIATILYIYINLVRRVFGYMVNRNRFYSPRKFTKDQWLNLLRKSKPIKQQDLLTHTNYQSLGLSPAEFLEILYEVETDIKKEPALSAYWEQRDKLETALKQERQG
jgi:hypothetical protein